MRIRLLAFFTIFTFFSFAKEINLVLSYNTFYSEKGYTYFELYYLLDPTSLTLIQEDGLLKGGAEITVTFSQGDQIINYDKLLIGVAQDSSALGQGILQQSRLRLDTGAYDFKLIVKDINDPQMKPIELGQKMRVDFDFDSPHFSTPMFLNEYKKTEELNEFSRNGYDLYPYITLGTPYFHEGYTKLSFYTELYNVNKELDAEEPFLVSYYMRNENEGEKINKYSGYEKQSSKSVIPMLKSFNIEKLESGNYSFILEARDKENNIIAKDSTFFYRFNPTNLSFDMDDLSTVDITGTWVEKLNNFDTLYRYLDCLYPISTQVERRFTENQLRGGDIENMKRYFLAFWKNKNPSKPKDAWEDYYNVVQKIDKKYRTSIMPGYKTSRGRVYLQYGEPYLVESSVAEPRTYPYEIWQYQVLESPSTNYQVNKIFVFINYMVGSNDFELAHSDAVGEIYDPRWKLRLQKRDYAPTSVDQDNSSWGVDRSGSKYDNNIILGGQTNSQRDFMGGGGN
jgi:GWxTD domain-containing protein